MSGIASVLNIAKEALLAHQSSISVTGHNIANVNTPGYSRQVLNLVSPSASPEAGGFFGTGVKADTISRQYDQFMVKRITDQNSSITNLEAEQQTLRVVETIFNEAPGLAVNDLMSQFWEATQGLSNNPELSASRQAVVQQAELLDDQLHSMTSQIVDSRNDISLSIGTSVDDLNSLTKELAGLNTQITTTETDKQQQNDLRDSRDQILMKISGLVGINYFETSTGAYTVMLDDGHTVVEDNDAWSFDWSENSLYWQRTNSNDITTKAELTDAAALGGTLGGLIEVNNQLVEGNPDNYLGRLNSLANALIREVNQQYSQGVGLNTFTEPLTGTELANDTTLLHTTLDSQAASETIAAGTFTINDRVVGKIDGSTAVYGLAMGKTFNAAETINAATAGVEATLTTQVAGSAVTGLAAGESVSFTVNGVDISYTAPALETAGETATNVTDAINSAIDAYNLLSSSTPKVTIRAIVGNGLNGGASNSLILKNTKEGDSSQIIIGGIDTATADGNLGIADGTYVADSTHNTGELSLFALNTPLTINGGSNDQMMAQLGWASSISYADMAVSVPAVDTTVNFEVNGIPISANILSTDTSAVAAQKIIDKINVAKVTTGVTAILGDGTNGGVPNSVVFQSDVANIDIEVGSPVDESILGFSTLLKRSVAGADQSPGDGKLSYEFSDHGVLSSMHGYDYSRELVTDGGSFDMWLYNSNGTNALPQAVTVSLDRAYTLQDVADSFNISMKNANAVDASGQQWVTASVFNNQITFTPSGGHQFAFGGDTSNFLATAGINTFFTGSSADSININSLVSEDLNNLATGTVNQFGEMFTGDNSNILEITNIQRKEAIAFIGSASDTLDGHYNSLVAEIGLKSKSVEADLEFNIQVNDQLNIMRDAASGVSLDEEMANLIKFQHAYSAAAKLITASDEMMQTLLNTI